MNDMHILGIESSCDDTSAAVVKNGRELMSNIISSQNVHLKFGGVVPEIASRKHIENISDVVDAAINSAQIDLNSIDAIAVTCGPGLVGALLVGVAYAKGLAYSLKKPLIGVHHIEGHICANFIDNLELTPPFMSLVVSGGHTHLAFMHDYCEYEIIGRTRDDAAGEAYDKIARTLGLGFPGGPEIDALAATGNASIDFPRIFLGPDTHDFSFSGLKSAVLNYINRQKIVNPADVAASFQKAVVDVLVTKALAACVKYNIKTLVLAGGVASNSALRSTMAEACADKGISLYLPSPMYCTDNAAMIASAGYYRFLKGQISGLDLNAYPSLAL